METIRVYGEAQLARTLDNDALNVVVFYGDDQKSNGILNHLKTLKSSGEFKNVRIALVAEGKLPKDFYRRRAITTTPSVAYYHKGDEKGRMTGHHTLKMLSSNIKRHLGKIK